MPRLVLFLLLLMLAAPLSVAQTKHKTAPPKKGEPTAAQKQQFADDQETINAMHDKDIQASMALDAAALESLWTDDIVTIPPNSPPVVGRDANVKRLQEGVDAMTSTEMLAYNEEFQEVNISGDMACEIGVISGRTRPMAGGKESSFRYNIMRILKRQPDGAWKIARSMYNDATPMAAPPKPPEPPKPDDKNKLKD